MDDKWILLEEPSLYDGVYQYILLVEDDPIRLEDALCHLTVILQRPKSLFQQQLPNEAILLVREERISHSKEVYASRLRRLFLEDGIFEEETRFTEHSIFFDHSGKRSKDA